MQFTFRVSDLKSALEAVHGTVGSCNITEGVLVTGGDELTLTTTNVQNSTVRSVEGDGLGSFVVPYKQFRAIIGRIRSETVKVAVSGKSVSIEGGRVKASMQTFDVDGFPSVRQPIDSNTFTIGSVALLEGISRLSYAIGKDASRPHLGGLYLKSEGDGSLMACATDGHRLSVYGFGEVDGVDFREIKDGVIIDREVIQSLEKLLKFVDEDVTVGVDGYRVSFKTESTTVVSSLIEGGYPNYKQVVPSRNRDAEFSVNVDDLANALGDVLVLANARTKSARMKFCDDVIELESDDAQTGAETFTSIDADGCKDNGMKIGINISYMLDVLRAAGTDDIKLNLTGVMKPICIYDDSDDFDGVSIVMPMRV